MIKKTLFTLFLFVATIVLSQEKTIENLSTAPNPFKQNTNISFKVNTTSTVTLLVKNVFEISLLLVWRERTLEEAQICDINSLKGNFTYILD